MFTKFIKWLRSNSQQSQLEQYIISKNPTNAAEVEYWTREYEAKQFVWVRGF